MTITDTIATTRGSAIVTHRHRPIHDVVRDPVVVDAVGRPRPVPAHTALKAADQQLEQLPRHLAVQEEHQPAEQALELPQLPRLFDGLLRLLAVCELGHIAHLRVIIGVAAAAIGAIFSVISAIISIDEIVDGC